MYMFLVIPVWLSFCFLSNLLVEIDIISHLLAWETLMESWNYKGRVSGLTYKLISALIYGPSSILAVCQHAVQEKMFFPPLNLLGM